MSSAGNNFYLQFFQSVLLPAGWTAPPQHIGEGTPAERLDLGCYSAHIFSRSVVIHGTILRRRTPSMLLSGTQFSPSRIGAARTVCRPAVVIQRIILLAVPIGISTAELLSRTHFAALLRLARCCYSAHILYLKIMQLLSAAQFSRAGFRFSAIFSIVILRTFYNL